VSAKDTIKYAFPDLSDTNKLKVIDSNYLKIVNAIKDNPYSANYDTALKGGFSICYYYNKSGQYLLYKKGQKVIDTIGSCSLGVPYSNLGYMGADFDKAFVFVQSFGSGNPHIIQLYDKATAKNLIKEGSALIGVDTTHQTLLYSEQDVPSPADKMTLFDTKTNSKNKYEFPKEIFAEPEILNRIKLVTVTYKTFTIEYQFKGYKQTKRLQYSR